MGNFQAHYLAKIGTGWEEGEEEKKPGTEQSSGAPHTARPPSPPTSHRPWRRLRYGLATPGEGGGGGAEADGRGRSAAVQMRIFFTEEPVRWWRGVGGGWRNRRTNSNNDRGSPED
jgi:hypothetical protein